MRSILLGWAALFVITYLMERPLLLLTAHFVGASWLPTEQLALACAGLAAAGWLIGLGNRFDVLLFAATLAVWNFGLVPINLPWLVPLDPGFVSKCSLPGIAAYCPRHARISFWQPAGRRALVRPRAAASVNRTR